MLASSNHAVGFYRRSDANPAADGRFELVDPGASAEHVQLWTKAAIESLGALYHDRYGIDVIALRIGTCVAVPSDVRALAKWMSPGSRICPTESRPGRRPVHDGTARQAHIGTGTPRSGRAADLA